MFSSGTQCLFEIILVCELSKCLFEGGFCSRKYSVSVSANATDSVAQYTEDEQCVVS